MWVFRPVSREGGGRGVDRESALAIVRVELALKISRGERLQHASCVHKLVVLQETNNESPKNSLGFPGAESMESGLKIPEVELVLAMWFRAPSMRDA